MVSILIPVYNRFVKEFVLQLNNEAQKLNIIYEIIIIDDLSEEKYQTENRKLKKLPNVNYIQLLENKGRAKIRNLLVIHSQYNILIFTDCDMLTVKDNYIKNYIENIEENTILCGGIKYKKSEDHEKKHVLRLKYGSRREAVDCKIRNIKPFNSFMTGNFCMNKSIFKKITFNERLTGYGHEDTLFGYEIKRKGIKIKHINNPLYHCGIDDANEFIKKTENAVRNLKHIYENFNEPEISTDIKLLKVYLKIYQVKFLFKIMFNLTEKLILINLKSKYPSLFLFDLYKLGYLCSLK